MNEIKHEFFGVEVTAKIGHLDKEIIPISVVDKESSQAWENVFLYDNSVDILESDSQKLEQLVAYYQSKYHRGSNLILKAPTMLVALITRLERIVRGILRSFIGFGLIGFLLVISLLIASLVFSLYAIILAAPFVIIGHAVKWYLDRRVKNEVKMLQQAILSGLNLQQKKY